MHIGGGYAHALMRRYIAHICETEGFTHAEDGSLDLLARATANYIEIVSKHAQQMAEFAGRTRANITDVTNALERCETVFHPHAGPPRDGEETEMDEENVDEQDNVLADIPPIFPIPVVSNPGPSSIPVEIMQELGEVPHKRDPHIPSFLPSFPLMLQRSHEQHPEKGSTMVNEALTGGREAAISALTEISKDSKAGQKNTNEAGEPMHAAHHAASDASILMWGELPAEEETWPQPTKRARMDERIVQSANGPHINVGGSTLEDENASCIVEESDIFDAANL